LWRRWGSDRELGDQCATENHDLFREPRVLHRVHDVNSGGEDSDHLSFGSDGAHITFGIFVK
jgi:hypothetical protein